MTTIDKLLDEAATLAQVKSDTKAIQRHCKYALGKIDPEGEIGRDGRSAGRMLGDAIQRTCRRRGLLVPEFWN